LKPLGAWFATVFANKPLMEILLVGLIHAHRVNCVPKLYRGKLMYEFEPLNVKAFIDVVGSVPTVMLFIVPVTAPADPMF
jgi:hypothetical protein